MDKGQYWFRKVPGTSSRYRAINWRGSALIVAAVAMPLALTFMTAAIRPWLAFAIFPIALFGSLTWLFTVLPNRVEPSPPSDS